MSSYLRQIRCRHELDHWFDDGLVLCLVEVVVVVVDAGGGALVDVGSEMASQAVGPAAVDVAVTDALGGLIGLDHGGRGHGRQLLLVRAPEEGGDLVEQRDRRGLGRGNLAVPPGIMPGTILASGKRNEKMRFIKYLVLLNNAHCT